MSDHARAFRLVGVLCGAALLSACSIDRNGTTFSPARPSDDGNGDEAATDDDGEAPASDDEGAPADDQSDPDDDGNDGVATPGPDMGGSAGAGGAGGIDNPMKPDREPPDGGAGTSGSSGPDAGGGAAGTGGMGGGGGAPVAGTSGGGGAAGTGGTPGPVGPGPRTFEFEVDAQGWRDLKDQGSVVRSSDSRAFQGRASLAVDLNTLGTVAGDASQRYIGLPRDLVPSINAGSTLTFRVWLPAGHNLLGVQPFLVSRRGDWMGNWQFTDTLQAATWVELRVSVPPAFEVNRIEWFGVQFQSKPGGWQGTVYIDSVAY